MLMGRNRGSWLGQTGIIEMYEELLSEGRIEPDGPAYSRLQKLKLDKLMRSKYGSYYAKRSKRLHGRIQRENER